MNKTPNQIQTQINDDILGFHSGLASLLHQVPSINLGCRPRELQRGCLGMCFCHSAHATALPLLLLLTQSVNGLRRPRAPPETHNPSLPSATSVKGKPGRQGTWKPPHNERDGSGMLQMPESFHSERGKSGSPSFQETQLGRMGRTGRDTGLLSTGGC